MSVSRTRLRRASTRLFAVCLLALAVVVTRAQQPATDTRDWNQPQDEAFAKLYTEWTGDTKYGSPLVDHLPIVKGIPTPNDVIGHHVGAPRTLTYYADMLRYYRALAEATPRVKVEAVGRSDEGRDLVVVWVTSEQNMKGLQANRDRLAKIADPRGLSEVQVRELIAATKPNYHVIGGLHSGETGASEMLMELVYRLATETSPIVSKIRDHVYVSVTPVADPDGRDRYVDWFCRGLETAAATDSAPATHWREGGEAARWDGRRRRAARRSQPGAGGRSTRRRGRDDGRAVLGQVRLPRQQPRHQPVADDQPVADQLVLHRAPARDARPARVDVVDVHLQRRAAPEPEPRSPALRRTALVLELGTLADDEVGDAGRLHARVHGRLVAGILRVGRVQPQRRDEDVRNPVRARPCRGGRAGGPGRRGARGPAGRSASRGPAQRRVRRGTAWRGAGPGPAGRGAPRPARRPPRHREVRRQRRVSGPERREGQRGGTPPVPTGRGGAQDREWYRGLPVPPNAAAAFSRRANTNYMQTGVLSSLQLVSQFPTTVVENFYVKTRNAIEDGRTKAPYGFVIPVQRDMTRATELVKILRMQRIEVGHAASEFKLGDATYAAGSYVIKRDQPYGRLAKNLLERQQYPDTRLTTYDDSGWTMGLLMGVDVKEIGDAGILKVATTPVTKPVLRGKVAGRGTAGLAVAHLGSNYMIAFRYRMRTTPMKVAEKSFTADGVEFPAGSLIIEGPPAAAAKAAIEELGLTAAALSALPTVPMHDAPAPRIAIYSQWTTTQDLGWYRLTFDNFGIPYDLIYKEQVKQGDLRAKYDVIVMAAQNITRQAALQPASSRPQPYQKSDKYKFLGTYGETADMSGGFGQEGVDAFATFLEGGGTLIAAAGAARFPIEFGWAHTVDAEPITGVTAQRPIVQADILRTDHPVFYGYTGSTMPVKYVGGFTLRAGVADQANVLARYTGGDASVLSGAMVGADQLRQKAFAVDIPRANNGKGRVLLFSNNPIYRWQNHLEFNMVFNAIMNWNYVPTSS